MIIAFGISLAFFGYHIKKILSNSEISEDENTEDFEETDSEDDSQKEKKEI